MLLQTILKYIYKKSWLIVLIGISIAYFPLISSVMSIKNDSCVLSYPIFNFFSSQLHNGIIPFWHFNMHFGFALYADPGTPFLNPIFWLFALANSSIYTYVLYILFHIVLGSIGMFLLGKQLGFEQKTNTILAVAYIAGGYFVAHLQHSNHIIECTYLPFVINFLYALFKKPNLKNTLLLGLFLYLFTISGYPGFAIGMPYYIIILGIGYIINQSYKKKFPEKLRAMGLFCISVAIAIILCLPFLYALYTNMENFQRASTFSGNSYLFEGGASPVLGFASFILPLASVVKNSPFLSSDMAWNNMYIGIVVLIFFLASIKYKNLFIILPHLMAIAFFLDISFEGQIKQLFFKLPLLNFLRYNGGLRIYAMLSMIIVAGYTINNFFITEKLDTKRLVTIIKILFIIVSAVLVTTIIYSLINHSFIFNNEGSLAKKILHINLSQAIILQSVYVLIVLFFFKKWINNKRSVLLIALVDIIICFWVNLPFSGLSIKSMPTITRDIEASSKFINEQQSFTIQTDSVLKPAINHVVYAPALLSNKVGVIPPHAYPSGKKTYFEFIEKNGLNYFNNKPTCFLQSKNTVALPYTINAESIKIECSTTQQDTLIIFQNFDKNWKAYSNNNMLTITQWKNNFMQIILPANTKNIQLIYNDNAINKLLFVPIIGLLTILFILLYTYKKNN